MDSDNSNDMLEQSESLDSDEVRNDDGDAVADPPERWISAEEHETLDEKLAAEVSDRAGQDRPLGEPEEPDNIDPEAHGRERGQIDGTPEDGDSFYDVER